MATDKKLVEIISAGKKSILENVGDKGEFELTITRGEKEIIKAKKPNKDGDTISYLMWKFSALLRDEVTKDAARDAEDNEIWVNFSVFFGEINHSDSSLSKVNYQYIKFRNMLFPELGEVEQEMLRGSEILKAILKKKYFLVTLEAGAPFVSDKGVEYSKYNFKDIQDSMIIGGGTADISEDTILGLWDE